MTDHAAFMRRAAELARASVEAGGGPFGALIVRAGEILGEGANRVTLSADPTAHAEVLAIRAAAERLGTHDLSGAAIYTSCEPCPMCLGAIYWARLDHVWYANDRRDAAAIGFDDERIYADLQHRPSDREIPFTQLESPLAREAFRAWNEKPDKERY